MVLDTLSFFLLSRRALIFILITFTSISTLHSQDRCGTVQYNKSLTGNRNQTERFENWISQKITKGEQSTYQQSKVSEEVLYIPIVVHIVHNNEPLGEGLNITDDQVQSQIDVLNEDFRRLNSDRSETPISFLSVAADINIEFILAKQDPEGLATNGILRVIGTRSQWEMSDNSELKALSYWPAEDYLNLWVTDVASPLLGYAQFPVSDELEGLEQSSSNSLTDGVVVDFQAFGSIDKFPEADLKASFAKGRTATHEIGHFLGLVHIWGDSTCGTDYCEDTPTQQSSTSGCPSHPTSGGCGTVEKMFQNFMDYTNDQCMNLFTLDQNDRMRAIIENSPRRLSLTSSPALNEPIVYNNDLGILEVTNSKTTCDNLITPSITIKNYGNSILNNAQIRFGMNGSIQETINVNLGDLNLLASMNVAFTALSLSEGDNSLSFEIISINGISDDNTTNNSIQHTINLPQVIVADITETFEDGISNMRVNNIDGSKTWELVTAPNETIENQSLFINYFDYEIEGTEDWLISQVMDFSNISAATLIFDYAHAQYPGREDQLSILISNDCGISYNELFNKSGQELRTTSSTNSKYFVPTDNNDWKSESIDLSTYIGETSIKVAFVGKNGYGNNIYLDNISLVTSDLASVKLQQISNPVLVSASETQPLEINVKNIGGITINQLNISYSIDNGTTVQSTIEELDIESGQSEQLLVSELTSTEGSHTISVTISAPNGIPDEDITDNSQSTNYIIELSTDVIPLREKFEIENNWVTATRSDVLWESINLQEDTKMYVNSSQNENTNGIAWLVSPMLDLRETSLASMFFDLSYAPSSNGKSDVLKVLLSENGGLDNFPYALWSESGSDLATISQVMDNWTPNPATANHWRRDSIDLSNYTGQDSIRIAFQLTNANANNLYIDNIEFYQNDNLSPIDIDSKSLSNFPNPIFSSSSATFSLIFNLEERQKAEIRIFDLAGNQVFSQHESYALNQTFTYDASNLPSGVLILSIIGETFKYNSKISVIR